STASPPAWATASISPSAPPHAPPSMRSISRRWSTAALKTGARASAPNITPTITAHSFAILTVTRSKPAAICMSNDAPIAIIGAGPAGLFAAEVLGAAGRRVVVYERMPSVARKFLKAGRGGLNLTRSEDLEKFLARYGDEAANLTPIIEAFTANDLVAWANGLGVETFVGSSGRVFPKAMKASPLLRAWLARLSTQGVEIQTRSTWLGWNDDGSLRFDTAPSVNASATLLALGGASWPRLGADGSWREPLAARGVEIAPLQPANVGFRVAWSDHFRERFAGQPLKNVEVKHYSRHSRGEVMITNYGVEGGPIYALSRYLRETSPTIIRIDLRPDLRYPEVEAKL